MMNGNVQSGESQDDADDKALTCATTIICDGSAPIQSKMKIDEQCDHLSCENAENCMHIDEDESARDENYMHTTKSQALLRHNTTEVRAEFDELTEAQTQAHLQFELDAVVLSEPQVQDQKKTTGVDGCVMESASASDVEQSTTALPDSKQGQEFSGKSPCSDEHQTILVDQVQPEHTEYCFRTGHANMPRLAFGRSLQFLRKSLFHQQKSLSCENPQQENDCPPQEIDEDCFKVTEPDLLRAVVQEQHIVHSVSPQVLTIHEPTNSSFDEDPQEAQFVAQTSDQNSFAFNHVEGEDGLQKEKETPQAQMSGGVLIVEERDEEERACDEELETEEGYDFGEFADDLGEEEESSSFLQSEERALSLPKTADSLEASEVTPEGWAGSIENIVSKFFITPEDKGEDKVLASAQNFVLLQEEEETVAEKRGDLEPAFVEMDAHAEQPSAESQKLFIDEIPEVVEKDDIFNYAPYVNAQQNEEPREWSLVLDDTFPYIKEEREAKARSVEPLLQQAQFCQHELWKKNLTKFKGIELFQAQDTGICLFTHYDEKVGLNIHQINFCLSHIDSCGVYSHFWCFQQDNVETTHTVDQETFHCILSNQCSFCIFPDADTEVIYELTHEFCRNPKKLFHALPSYDLERTKLVYKPLVAAPRSVQPLEMEDEFSNMVLMSSRSHRTRGGKALSLHSMLPALDINAIPGYLSLRHRPLFIDRAELRAC